MIRFKPLLWMSLFSIVSLAILIMLGNWQWGRYQEKLHARATPPALVALTSATPLPGRLQLVYAVKDGQAGWRVFAPVEQDGQAIFLDIGFTAGMTPPDWRTLREPFPTAPIAVKGVRVMPHARSWAAAKPDIPAHAWYAIDLETMGRTAGLEDVAPYYLALPYIGQDGALAPNPFVNPDASAALPPERHLGYALTWWGLAAALIGVYAAFHARAGRLSFGRKA